jgi:hypothetical protein
VLDRIDEIITLLQAYALGELTLPKRRVTAALRLLDLAIDDALPPDGDGEEMPELADDRVVLIYPPRFAA